jgi:hypothetical protein
MIQPWALKHVEVHCSLSRGIIKRPMVTAFGLSDPQTFSMIGESDTRQASLDELQCARHGFKDFQIPWGEFSTCEAAHELDQIGRIDVDRESKALSRNRSNPIRKISIDVSGISHESTLYSAKNWPSLVVKPVV